MMKIAWSKLRTLQIRQCLMAVVFPAMLLTSGLVAAASEEKVQWQDPSWVQLEIDFPGNGYHASWHLSRCQCGDLLVRSELNVPGEVTYSEILLVSQRAVLKRGYEPEQADQISFEAPALMMQLALRLLQRSEPSGPMAITEKIFVDVEDQITHISLDTGVAIGGFPAPWSVKGSIWPQAERQRRFELYFSFNSTGLVDAEQEQTQMVIAGVAEYALVDFPLSDDIALGDWEFSWRNEEDEMVIDTDTIKTLGGLRKQLAEQSP
jgi:hypothetical protein